MVGTPSINRRLGVSLAELSKRRTFSRSSTLSRSRSVLVNPARRPRSRSACRTHLRSVSAAQPNIGCMSATGCPL